MNYATGYALNAEELFHGFPTRKLSMTTELCKKYNGDRHKEKVAEKIWKAHVRMVIDDVIDNNATFELPVSSKEAFIHINEFLGDNFIKGRQKGKWKDVDYLASNFTGHLMELCFQRGQVMLLKNIYLDPKNKKRITDNTNKGKSYY